MLYHLCVGCTEFNTSLMVVRFMIKSFILEILRNVSYDIEFDERELWCHTLFPCRYDKSLLMTISSEPAIDFLMELAGFIHRTKFGLGVIKVSRNLSIHYGNQ